jgi:branched-subunit amino acid aminotransferase/4-amino-4-deoxychorismate lyase
MMTDAELKARRAMYDEIAMCRRRAKQTNAQHEIRRWDEHADRVQRAIDLLSQPKPGESR